MENKNRNKIIIFFVILLAIIALITITLLCVNNKKGENSSIQDESVEVSRNNRQDIDAETKEHLNNDKQKENNNSNEISDTNKNEVIENKADENKTNQNETTENTQSDVNNKQVQQNSGTSQNSEEISADESTGTDVEQNNSGSTALGNGSTTSANTNNQGSNAGTNTSHSTTGGNTGIIQNEDDNESFNVEIENNGVTGQNGGNTNPEYTDKKETTEQTPSISNMKVEDSERLDIVNNEYSKLDINFNLLNAPYNNKEYCEEKLKDVYFIKLSELPENGKCSNFPTTITINNDGELDEFEHIYTKTGYVDFSKTKFSCLGDYVFDICSETTGDTLYQVIVTLRSVTTDEGYPVGKTYSLIQLKSILQSGEKVDKLDINIQNPSTYITIKKEKNKNSFNEKVYVDLLIDSYEQNKYTVLDGNNLDKVLNGDKSLISSLEIGEHIVARNTSNELVAQTYKLANDGKILVGRKYQEMIKQIAKVASLDSISNLGIKIAREETNKEKIDNFQIPVGTKYRAVATPEKNYREEYEILGVNNTRIAQESNSENEIIIKNITAKNPKTGIFYNIVPFVIVIILAIVGIIVIKKLSSKKEDDENEE